MARRRSLNRRWSRRSGNITELDQDSEVFDRDNPAWWKNLPDATLQTHSLQNRYSETTEPLLTRDSLVEDSELHDRWWDNLERTNLQSSRRFSIRQSINPENPVQESFVSEDGNEDVSIKKRKVVLRAKSKKKSGGTENFLKAFDNSDDAKSEPTPSRNRNPLSPTRSETDVAQRKTRGRSSRSLANTDHEHVSLNTSNDADVVVKTRPGAFKQRLDRISANVYDEILSNPGPSRINAQKNAPEIEIASTLGKVVDSNESGGMGPPFSVEERKKRLSTVSKKLDMTSDESEGDAKPKKFRHAFKKISNENASFNPFDEILSSQLDESTSSGVTSNASGRASNAATRMSKSSKHSQSLRDHARVMSKDFSASVSELRTSQRTVVEEATGDQKTQAIRERVRRSSSVLNENSGIARKRSINTTNEEAATSEWDIPETQDERKNSSRRAMNRTTMIEKSMSVEKSPETQEKRRRSPSVLSENSRVAKRRSRNTTNEEAATSEWAVPETQDEPKNSSRRAKNPTMIEKSMSVEKSPETQEKRRRSPSVLSENSRVAKRRSRNTTFEEENAASAYNVPETQEDPENSIRRTGSSITMIAESEDVLQLPESQEKNRRSSSKLKNSQRASKRRTRDSPIFETTVENDFPEHEDKKSKSTSSFKENTRNSKRKTRSSKSRSEQSMRSSTLTKSKQSQLLEDWESSEDVQEDEIERPTEQSLNNSRLSSTKKILEVSKNRSSAAKSSLSRRFKDSDDDEQQEEIMLRLQGRSIEESAYELPDKERSASLSISMSENESPMKKLLTGNTSARKSSTKQFSPPQSVNRSINAERSHARREVSLSRVDYDENIDNARSRLFPNVSVKSIKNVSSEEKAASRITTASTNAVQQEDSDQSISEELAVGPQKLNVNLSGRSSRLGKNIEAPMRASSRQSGRSDGDSEDEMKLKTLRIDTSIANRKTSTRSNISRAPVDSDRSISEEESNLKSMNPPQNDKSVANRKIYKRSNISRAHGESDQSISEEESASKSMNPPQNDKSVANRTTSKRSNISSALAESDRSISEEESASKSINPPQDDKSVAARRSSARPNMSRQLVDSDPSISEEESASKSINPPQREKSATNRRSSTRPSVSRQFPESDESGPEENDENLENVNSALDKSSKRSNLISTNISKARSTINRNEASSSALENINENTSSTIPSESIPLSSALTKIPKNSVLRKNETDLMQKTITDFFPARQQSGRDLTKALERFKNFDREKMALLKEELDTQRQRDKTARVKQMAEKKEVKKLAPKKNTTKPPKVVDKAYIVNGQVYKKPKLPRPKPWATDRLYRHLWKRMEPKYNLRTRVKSERFVEQLAAVVALTIRRKKYENYKDEVDALMREMARLDIIKTRNDFYDFCYDYLPYDFRVKVTPMLHPGNIRIVPYDPATLHTPILTES